MQGSLTQNHLPTILHSLSNDEESGILQLSQERVNKRIYFGQGSMIFAASDQYADRLGEFLVRKGMMTRTHLELASQQMRQTGRKLGETLVTMGLMTPEEMRQRVAEQVQGIIYSLFAWDDGQYNFRHQSDPIERELALSLPRIPIILEGVRRMGDAVAIRRGLGDLGRVVSYSRDPWILSYHVNLTPEEGFVLSRVDGQCSALDILSISPLGEEQTLRCLYGLISAGFLEFGVKSHHLTPSARRASAETSLSGSSSPRRGATSSEGEEPRLSPEQQWVREDILSKHASASKGTFYQCLELRRSASEEDIKSAYLSLVKKYHPDRHHSPQLRDLKPQLEEIFAKVTDAYHALMDSVHRRRYDNSLRTEAPKGEDVTPRSSPVESPSSQEAARTGKMASYCYRAARDQFRAGDFHAAIELLEEALRIDPSRPEYHKLLGQALARNPHWRKNAVEHFETALRLAPFDVESVIGLGEVYEAAGMPERARRLFAQALELDPDNGALKRKLGWRGRRMH